MPVFVILLVKGLEVAAAVLDGPPPRAVRLVPADGRLEAGVERRLRRPPERPDLPPIDGVAAVVAQPVRHELDEVARLPEQVADPPGDLDVRDLVPGADVVGLARRPPPRRELDRPAVVVDVEPVAHVRSLPVERERLPFEGVGHEQRDELLRVLIRSVVVARPEDDDRQAVGHVVGVGQAVGPGLARGVGRGRGDRVGLPEEALVPAAVDLVGRDVDEELDVRRLLERLEQDEAPVDVGQDELAGVDDRPVDVRLGREVDDALDAREERATSSRSRMSPWTNS